MREEPPERHPRTYERANLAREQCSEFRLYRTSRGEECLVVTLRIANELVMIG